MTREPVAAPGSEDRLPEPRRGRRRQPHPLERLTIAHTTLFVIATTWAFGGQAEWVRGPLVAWGSLGILITLAAILRPAPSEAGSPLRWGMPLLAFNALVLAASLNPSLRPMHYGAETLLVDAGANPAWPSTARPALARAALWRFDVIWCSCFNVALVVRRRRAIRGILLVLALNAILLAIFGTVQNLVHARGIFFGAVPTPQKYFFASFVYHNHWGAFMILMIALAIALAWHYTRRSRARDALHSPAFMGGVAILILATTVPLSASRSSTVLVAVLLAGAALHWAWRMMQRRRQLRESPGPAFALAGVVVLTAALAIGYVGRGPIVRRYALTLRQLHHTERIGAAQDSRAELYRDTGRMALAKPWFGWGMASYPYVFTLFNSRRSVDGLPVFYHDAHSDWLQAWAEHGVFGTALLALAGLLPLASLRRAALRNSITLYLLAGCALVLAYAWVEFPFGNFAVVLCWWLMFICAIQYGRLSALEMSAGSPDAALNPR